MIAAIAKLGDKMAKKSGPEFRLETAQLVVHQGYSNREAAEVIGVEYSTIGKWVKQLREERAGKARMLHQ